MPPALSAHGLSKRYGRRTWALRDISLSIPAGTTTALIGPNAAGKSTLIRTWMSFEQPTSGKAAVNGHDAWRGRDRIEGSIGYIAQRPALFRDLSVRDHLRLVRHLRPTFDQSRAEGHIVEADLDPDQRAGNLSGGQALQLSLAIILGLHPRILLLDEPLASLDPLARREFLASLSAMARAEGLTVLLSSHIVGELRAVVDSVVVLGVGRVLLQGQVRDVVRSHVAVTESRAAASAVGRILDHDGNDLWILPSEGAPASSRPATLEEVAMAYLDAGRTDQPVGQRQ